MKFTLFIVSFFANLVCVAQTDSSVIVPADSLVKKKNTLTLAAVYANNASYFGQRPAENTPYFALSATYQFKSGIYFSGLAYKILDDNTSDISAANIGAGVNWKFSKKLSGDLLYTHSFYPRLSPLIQAVNNENITLALKHKSWLETTLSGDYAFGESNDIFTTGGIAKDIDLFSIGKKDVVSVKPFAYVTGGTQRFYKNYITTQKLRDSLLGTITGPIFGEPSTDTATVSGSSFDLISYNLDLPLSYNRGHYVIEALYQVSLMSRKAQARPGKVNSFFTLSFYYQF